MVGLYAVKFSLFVWVWLLEPSDPVELNFFGWRWPNVLYLFMKKPVSLFITYNPQNQSERILANRLHTIAAVNGFNAFLPDRFYDGFIISDATRKYIQIADYFILFSFGPLSEAVKSEIILAY